MPPLVSVCIPAYNNAATIKETIESVVASDYPNIEIIVVDDCSGDDTFRLLQEIESPLLSLHQNEKNLGMAGNWNKCLSLCRGKYIRLLCGDDRIAPDLISREVEIMEADPHIVMVSSDTAFVNESGKVVGHYNRYRPKGSAEGSVPGEKIVKYSLFTRDYLGAPLANLFRREAAPEFDPEFSYIIDYDFFINIALQGDVYIIPEQKNYFMLRDTSNTSAVLGGRDGKLYVKEHKRLLDKYGKKLRINAFGRWLSLMIRRATVVLGGLYLKTRGRVSGSL